MFTVIIVYHLQSIFYDLFGLTLSPSQNRAAPFPESPCSMSKIADMCWRDPSSRRIRRTSASSVKYEGHAKSELRLALTFLHKGIPAPCLHFTI